MSVQELAEEDPSFFQDLYGWTDFFDRCIPIAQKFKMIMMLHHIVKKIKLWKNIDFYKNCDKFEEFLFFHKKQRQKNVNKF